MKFYQDFKLGILGGGQLGRMLIQAGIDFNLSPSVLDPDEHAPCSKMVKEFQKGDLTDFETVYAFGKGKDLITIEIENVNADALARLEQEGVKVFPQPSVIKIIQDKRLQKQFFKDHGIPTAEFVLVNSKDEINAHGAFLPAFQKLGTSGYDGRGVQKIETLADVDKALEGPGLLEKKVNFAKEISVIVARNNSGAITVYPVVEMVFHEEQNLVEFLFAPAEITDQQEQKAREIAVKVIENLKMTGLLAVEMFVDSNGEVLVNEIAPRPHNSGHQTIKGNYTSQYEQHLRAILNLPLGATALKKPAAMLNLLGEPGYEGLAIYEGIEDVLSVEGVFVHLYGKKYTKPFRKMGHITLLDEDIRSLKQKAEFVKKKIRVIA